MIRIPRSLADRQEYVLLIRRAEKALMTGPKATPPRWATLKRFLRQGGLATAHVNPLSGYRWGP
jgi:hypothetical protein